MTLRFVVLAFASTLLHAGVLNWQMTGRVTSVYHPEFFNNTIAPGAAVRLQFVMDESSAWFYGDLNAPLGHFVEYYGQAPSDGMSVSVQSTNGWVDFSGIGKTGPGNPSVPWNSMRLFDGAVCYNNVCTPSDRFDLSQYYITSPNLPAGSYFTHDFVAVDDSAPHDLVPNRNFPLSGFNLSKATFQIGSIDIYDNLESYNRVGLIYYELEAVPEPASFVLVGCGLAVLLLRRKVKLRNHTS